MIPKIIHQTWKTTDIPGRFGPWVESWRRLNPDWEYRLWTDRMLLDFVAERYPDFLPVYATYHAPIMRVDAARYLLLHHFGGVYADLDTECVASFDALSAEDRVVLCHEPPVHWINQRIHRRGLSMMLFNGLMASPAGHPFWRFLLGRLVECRFAPGVLDATGPFVLTGSCADYPGRETGIAVYPASLFCPLDDQLKPIPDYAPNPLGSLAKHYWAGTWYGHGRPRRVQRRLNDARTIYFKARHRLTRGEVGDAAEMRTAVAAPVLKRPPPEGDRLTILVPARDASEHIVRFRELVEALDHPKATTRIVFCEGDSSDDTHALLEKAVAEMRPHYRDAILLTYSHGVKIPRPTRWKPGLQRRRRTALAKVRNQLIDRGIDATDDWALWLDIDLWGLPTDIVRRLTSVGARIVAPHCVTYPGGQTFDRNSFQEETMPDDYSRYRHMKDGLFQPPSGVGRIAMDSLRYSERVELDGVGGTTLLVDAALHRAGLRFPEKPYNGHLETEGLGLLARDLGIQPIGLPRVEVLHVPW
jgi:hypothetical protein